MTSGDGQRCARLVLFCWALVVTAGSASGCQDDELRPPEEDPLHRFAVELQPTYWSSLDYDDPAKVRALPQFVARFSTLAHQVQSDLASGQLADPARREEAGRVLFHFGHMLHSNLLVTLEGRLTVTDLDPCPGSAGAQDPSGCLEPLMARSVAALELAAGLRPGDRRPQVALLAARVTQDRVATGHYSEPSVRALVEYATDNSQQAVTERARLRYPNFDLMVALLTLREVEEPSVQFFHGDAGGQPQPTPYMIGLTEAVQQRIVPSMIPGFEGASQSQIAQLPFVALTAPLLRSDYLARYAYGLWRTGQLEEAAAQALSARLALGLIRAVLAPLLQKYPLPNVIEVRAHFLDQLDLAIASNERGGALSLDQTFRRRDFIAPYLCSNCHAGH